MSASKTITTLLHELNYERSLALDIKFMQGDLKIRMKGEKKSGTNDDEAIIARDRRIEALRAVHK